MTEIAKLVKGYRELNKPDQLVDVLNRLAERTGDAGIKDDDTVKRVAEPLLRC